MGHQKGRPREAPSSPLDATAAKNSQNVSNSTVAPPLDKCQPKIFPRLEDCECCVFQGLEDIASECRSCRAISDADVERVQAAASLLDVMADYGVEVAEQPDGCYLGDCPFCQEGAA